MTDVKQQVTEFFAVFARANAEFDVPAIANLYADVFMFAGPQGAQAVRKEDFVKVLPKRKEFFKSAGLVSSKVESIEASSLDARYASAKVKWRMRFERLGAEPAENDNFATYILSSSGDSFQIVFQFDHQDLAKKSPDEQPQPSKYFSISSSVFPLVSGRKNAAVMK